MVAEWKLIGKCRVGTQAHHAHFLDSEIIVMKYNFRDNLGDENLPGPIFDDEPVRTRAKYRILGVLLVLTFWGVVIYVL